MKTISLTACAPAKIWQACKILLLLLIITSGQAAAQQQPKILAMSVETTIPAGDTTQLGSPAIDSLTQYSAVMTIILSDTGDIYLLHIKLGNSLHGNEYLSAIFEYGLPGNFGNLSYTQVSSNTIELGLGNDHAGMINFYAEVQVQKTDLTFEDIVTYSNN